MGFLEGPCTPEGLFHQLLAVLGSLAIRGLVVGSGSLRLPVCTCVCLHVLCSAEGGETLTWKALF